MAEIAIGAEVYNSFIGEFEADAYLAADVLRADSWAAQTPEAKARGLISATRLLLRMPWSDPAPDPAAAPEAIPDVLEEVTAMLAHDLLAKPKMFVDASGSSNVKSVGAGPARVEFFRPAGTDALLPLDLWTMLVNAGLMGSDDAFDDELPGIEAFGIMGPRRPLLGRYPGEYVVSALDYDG